MSNNQQGQAAPGSGGQRSEGSSQHKGAPDNPPPTPREQRTQARNDGKDR